MVSEEFFQKIFSISDYGETHKVLCIFGIRIKFPKSEYVKKKKNCIVNYYKQNNIPITEVPSATGNLRILQLANLELLKELDRVCNENSLEYWLDYGSVLGAVRHKGCIPWDDDIDVGMIRADYEKIVDVFNSSTKNPDMYAEYYMDNRGSVIIKIRHRKSNLVFVDIFPFDLCSKKIVKKGEINKTSNIKKQCKKLHKLYKNRPINDLREAYGNLRSEIIENSSDNDYVVRGLDFCGFPKNWFYKYDTIYPLKKVKYENGMFSCLNNTDDFLTSLYGNYMTYPSKIGTGHTLFMDISSEEMDKIKEITDKKYVLK